MFEYIEDPVKIAVMLSTLQPGESVVHIIYHDHSGNLTTGHRTFDGLSPDYEYLFRSKIQSDTIPLDAIKKVRISPIIAPTTAMLSVIPVIIKIPPKVI